MRGCRGIFCDDEFVIENRIESLFMVGGMGELLGGLKVGGMELVEGGIFMGDIFFGFHKKYKKGGIIGEEFIWGYF